MGPPSAGGPAWDKSGLPVELEFRVLISIQIVQTTYFSVFSKARIQIRFLATIFYLYTEKDKATVCGSAKFFPNHD